MEYTLIEQLLGTVFVILLVIFIIGKKLGVKWFSTFKMWYKGTWKEEWERKQTMKEKELTLVGWKELPLYLFHPRMFISKEWMNLACLNLVNLVSWSAIIRMHLG